MTKAISRPKGGKRTRSRDMQEMIEKIVSIIRDEPVGAYLSRSSLQMTTLRKYGILPTDRALRNGTLMAIEMGIAAHDASQRYLYRVEPQVAPAPAPEPEPALQPALPPRPPSVFSRRIQRIETMLESLCGQLGITVPEPIQDKEQTRG